MVNTLKVSIPYDIRVSGAACSACGTVPLVRRGTPARNRLVQVGALMLCEECLAKAQVIEGGGTGPSHHK